MQLNETKKLAKTLMKQHNLTDWKLTINNNKRRMGYCQYKTKTISLSRPYIKLNDETFIKSIILHEIAHALVGVGHHHDRIWKHKCLSIGGNGKTTDRTSNFPKGKYTLICDNCKKEITLYRKPKRVKGRSCFNCCKKHNKGRYTDKYQLRLITK